MESSGSRGSSSSCSRSASSCSRAASASASAAKPASSAASSLRRAPVVAGGREVARDLGDLGQLGVAAPERAGPRLIGVHGRIGQLTLDLGVLGEHRGKRGRAGALVSKLCHQAFS